MKVPGFDDLGKEQKGIASLLSTCCRAPFRSCLYGNPLLICRFAARKESWNLPVQ
jgi:hypothetical protein